MQLIKPNWPAPANIHAFSTTRIGGYSSTPYDSFNLGLHVGDAPALVAKNRQLLLATLPSEPIWLQQTHSNVAVEATKYQPESIADASYTQTKNVVCTAMTADCLPILLCDEAGTTVAAIHGGWRGLAQDIIKQTISQLPCAPNNLLAWLGPAIGPENFEVGDEVKIKFVDLNPQHQQAFRPQKDRWLMDIYRVASQQLQQLGITKIFGGEHCTFNDQKHFYSYRRDGQTGRMASVIWLS